MLAALKDVAHGSLVYPVDRVDKLSPRDSAGVAQQREKLDILRRRTLFEQQVVAVPLDRVDQDIVEIEGQPQKPLDPRPVRPYGQPRMLPHDRPRLVDLVQERAAVVEHVEFDRTTAWLIRDVVE